MFKSSLGVFGLPADGAAAEASKAKKLMFAAGEGAPTLVLLDAVGCTCGDLPSANHIAFKEGMT